MKKNAVNITILGSGTCVPSLKRCACSVFVETKKAKLLFDLGPGVMRRLLETGASIFDVSHIFLSHFHIDHCADLVPFLFSTKFSNETKRKEKIVIIAGNGFKLFYSRLQNAYGDWMEPLPDFAEIIELNDKKSDMIKFEEFMVESAPVVHQRESLAFKFSDSTGKSIVYSGDTDMSEKLVELSKKADVLVCESAHPDELKVKGHLTPSLAGDIAARAGVKKLVLTHLYPECDLIDIKEQCRKSYGGSLLIAEDLMKITI